MLAVVVAVAVVVVVVVVAAVVSPSQGRPASSSEVDRNCQALPPCLVVCTGCQATAIISQRRLRRGAAVKQRHDTPHWDARCSTWWCGHKKHRPDLGLPQGACPTGMPGSARGGATGGLTVRGRHVFFHHPVSLPQFQKRVAQGVVKRRGAWARRVSNPLSTATSGASPDGPIQNCFHAAACCLEGHVHVKRRQVVGWLTAGVGQVTSVADQSTADSVDVPLHFGHRCVWRLRPRPECIERGRAQGKKSVTFFFSLASSLRTSSLPNTISRGTTCVGSANFSYKGNMCALGPPAYHMQGLHSVSKKLRNKPFAGQPQETVRRGRRLVGGAGGGGGGGIKAEQVCRLVL